MDTLFKTFLEETDFQEVFKQKGYTFFTSGAWNLNLIGVRNLLLPKTGYTSNGFNDAILIIARETSNGSLKKWIFPASTDPGTYYRQYPMNSNGTAILVPGQYRGGWKLGVHSGYPALQQNKPVTVWRDKNKDGVLDMGSSIPKETGMFGINIHRASSSTSLEEVSKYSAGCQVIQNPSHWTQFMDIINKSASIYGKTFTYTLLEVRSVWS